MPNVPEMIRELIAKRRIPQATYRLQLNREFTLGDAKAIVPYLHALGITDVYMSPILMARPGSIHGYDICDHSRINPEIGTEKDLEEFSEELTRHNMGLLLDVVPNHMGIGHFCNTWWMDVLENGPSSLYADFFDVDWEPVKPELKNKVLLPILEDQYGKVLENAKLQLSFDGGAFTLSYYEKRFPIAPRTSGSILAYALESLAEALPPEDIQFQELQSILTALGYLPPRTEQDPERILERHREKEVIKRRTAALYETSPQVREAIDNAVSTFNGVAGDSHSFDRLDELIDQQAYQLSFWRVAAEEINYRRFFDINDLAALRTETPEVFEAVHELIFRFLSKGWVTGLRIDHADGLWNPAAYLKRLQHSYVLQSIQAHDQTAGSSEIEEWLAAQLDAREYAPAWPLYVTVEKILLENETLPREWPVYGTTGYDFLNLANGLFVDDSHGDELSQVYANFTGRRLDFRSVANAAKKMIMLVSLASEVYALSHRLDRISEKNRWYRDFTLNGLTFAIREVIAALRVYRTYISAPNCVSGRDRTFIEEAVAEARRRNPRTSRTLFEFIRDTLLLENLEDFREEVRSELIDWAMKFQQITPPVMAKGVEDTAFYVFNRLVSLNEVGGNPGQFGISVQTFHQQNANRVRRWPHSLLAGTTHDTKRSEDVRARINVLSEIPEEWGKAVARWGDLNRDKKGDVDGEAAPDANDEYLFYQVLIGAWPDEATDGARGFRTEEVSQFRDRMLAYMDKATKESKVHTSWINPSPEYDKAVAEFVSRVICEQNPFLREFMSFQRRVAFYGRFNALSQTLLKLACPGVPDTFQGSELWDLRLVDPDNRGCVDYDQRRKLLWQMKEAAGSIEITRDLLQTAEDGRIKLYLIQRTLGFRAAHRRIFSDGDYQPIAAAGSESRHVCAFARRTRNDEVVAVAPRLVVGLTDGCERPPLGEEIWRDTSLEISGKYRNVYTRETVSAVNGRARMAEVLAHFPVALLEKI